MTDEAPDDPILNAPLPNDPFTMEGIIAQSPVKPVWYRRVWVLASAVVAALVVASVVVDLPSHTTVATDTADQMAIMQQINTALAGCSYGVKETFAIYKDQRAGSLTASDRALTPSMLRDDQSACSFTSSSIYDLSNVQGTATPAGKDIGQVVNVATLWSTSDALAAIEDIQTLWTDPTDAPTVADLRKRQVALAKDRTQADNYVVAANRILHASIPMPDMPDLPTLHLPATHGSPAG
jgi:hypothetical protein